MTPSFQIRPLVAADAPLVARLLDEHWGSRQIVSRGKMIDASTLPGFLAFAPDNSPVGLVTLHVAEDSCEIVSLDAFSPGQGIGKALFAAAIGFARDHQIKRLWLITSNDNVNALGFYQKLGMRIAAMHRDAINDARKLKPQIPLVAENGIPIRDEIELEILL